MNTKINWRRVIVALVLTLATTYLLVCAGSLGYLLALHRDANLYKCRLLKSCQPYIDASDPAKANPRVCTLEEIDIFEKDHSVNLGCQIGFSGPFGGIPEEAKLQEKVLMFLVSPGIILYDYVKESY